MYCPACGYDRNPPGADTCAHCQLALAHLTVPAPQGPVECSHGQAQRSPWSQSVLCGKPRRGDRNVGPGVSASFVPAGTSSAFVSLRPSNKSLGYFLSPDRLA